MASQTVLAGPFIGGVNNRLADHAMAQTTPTGMIVDKLRQATNVTLDDTGRLRMRGGHTLVHADAGAHSGFDCSSGILYVVGGVLKLYNPDSGVTSVVASGLSNSTMAYVEVNGETYFSNSVDAGKVVAGIFKPWGIQPPNAAPSLSTVLGALPAGTYQVSITFESISGEESGSSPSASIYVNGSQGIAISGITASPPTGVSRVNIYCSQQNGDVQYAIAALSAGVTSFQFLAAAYSGQQLGTQFLSTPPPGNVLACANSRIYTAYGRVVCFTEPIAYGLYRPSRNFVWFPADVKIMAGVADGLYVVADKTYFLSGNDPKTWVLNPVLPYSGAFGSAARAPDEEDAWFWYGDRGLVKAGRGGQVKSLQEASLSLDAASSGATLFMEQKGIQQVVSLSAPLGYNTSAAAQGFVDMEVRRKGV